MARGDCRHPPLIPSRPGRIPSSALLADRFTGSACGADPQALQSPVGFSLDFGDCTMKLSVSAVALLVCLGSCKDVTNTSGATQIAITIQPDGAETGFAITTQPVVQLVDANGVLVADANAPVTATVV